MNQGLYGPFMFVPYYDEGKIDYDYIMNAYYILSGN